MLPSSFAGERKVRIVWSVKVTPALLLDAKCAEKIGKPSTEKPSNEVYKTPMVPLGATATDGSAAWAPGSETWCGGPTRTACVRVELSNPPSWIQIASFPEPLSSPNATKTCPVVGLTAA